jgi:hypothetical protein
LRSPVAPPADALYWEHGVMSLFSASSDGHTPARKPRKSPKAPAGPRGRLQVEALEDRCLPNATTISGFVYNDLNNNGIKDPGEPPIANVQVELHNAQNVVVGTAITDANGYYQFDHDQTVSPQVQTITKTFPFGPTLTNFVANGGVQQFDPSLGTLVEVDVTNAGSITSDIQVENTSTSSASTITANVGGSLTLSGPSGLTVQTNLSQNAGTFNASIYDNKLDFGGTSGKDFGNSTAVGTQTAVLTGAAMNAFIGGGSVPLSETAVATSSATGGGNLLVGVASSAAGQVTVTYKYIADNSLKPGNYVIYETQPPGYFDGKESSNGVVLNHPIGTDYIPVTVTTQGQNLPNNDFGELKASSLSGYVYGDISVGGYNDGIKQPGEPGIAGTTIVLDGNDDTGHVSRVTTTDANGFYKFDNLRAGGYTIFEVQPAGWQDGKDTIGTPGGDTINDQFGNIQLAQGFDGVNNNFGELKPGSIEGTVFYDGSPTGFNNGVQEAGEYGIGGVTVQLNGVSQGNPFTMVTVTDGQGHYKFSNLPAGTYQVVELQPVAYLNGKTALGSLGGQLGTDVVSSIVLTAGAAGVKYDFGELLPSTLSGYVYEDTSTGGFNNGIKDPGEAGIPGTLITLSGTDDQGAVSRTTTTDGTGLYSFTGLRPGSYTIAETQPAGYINGKTTVGVQGGVQGNDVISAVPLPPNTNGYNNNFGELKPVIHVDIGQPPEFPLTFTHPPSFNVPPVIPVISKTQLLTGNSQGVSDAESQSDAKFINTMYTAILNRQADQGGLAGWMLYLRSGGSRATLVSLLWYSDEHRAQEIDTLTRQILNQPAGPEEIAYYQNAFKRGWTELEVAADIWRFDATQETGFKPFLDKLFLVTLGTSPQQTDYDYYSSIGVSPYDIARLVIARPDSRALVVQQVYGQFLGRTASNAEVATWTAQFQAGLSYGDFTVAVLQSAEFAARGGL